MSFLNPRDVHAPAGPYSRTAIVPQGSELVFVAGQVGMRADGSIPQAFAEQADVAFQNVRACLPQLASPAFLVEVEAIAVKRAR